jgi:ubiquinone/menaquinone biosynthesis C-methylase UbiE
MGHYDLFSSFYDASTEKHYVEQRPLAIAALDLKPGMSALDLPCGTGQAFDGVAVAVLPGGGLVGVDFISGMLGKASKRVANNGWGHTFLLEGDARTVSSDDLVAAGAPAQVDRLHAFLGMSPFPGWRHTFANLWKLLVPGGRCVLVDLATEALTFQGRMVNWTAKADITRPLWDPLEAVASAYERRELPSKPLHGGTICLATGTNSQ